MVRTLLACLFVSTAVHAETAGCVASLGWMTGTWVHETEAATVTESWVGPRNGLMVAANLSTWTNGKRFHEFLRIADTPEGCSYFASPGGRPAEEFRMKEAGDRRIVFENPAKDFPRRILYWRDGEALMARIEGTVNGADKSESWRFTSSPPARGS